MSYGCFGCAGVGLQDKVDPAHNSVVYIQTSLHPGFTVFALPLSGGELSPYSVSVILAANQPQLLVLYLRFLLRDLQPFCEIKFLSISLGFKGKTTKSPFDIFCYCKQF